MRKTSKSIFLYLGLLHKTGEDLRAWVILFYKPRNYDKIRDMVAYRAGMEVAERVEIAMIGELPTDSVPHDVNPCRAIEVKAHVGYEPKSGTFIYFPIKKGGGPIYADNDNREWTGKYFPMRDPSVVWLNEIQRNLTIGFFKKTNFGRSEAQKRIDANPQPYLHKMFREPATVSTHT